MKGDRTRSHPPNDELRRNQATTQHGVRNDDAGRRPQESLSLRRGSLSESAVVLARPSQAIGAYDICDNNQNIVPEFVVDAILRE